MGTRAPSIQGMISLWSVMSVNLTSRSQPPPAPGCVVKQPSMARRTKCELSKLIWAPPW